MSGGISLRPSVADFAAAAAVLDENDDDSFCTSRSLYFLVPPKTTIAELITILVIAPLYAFFATYLAHPKTSLLGMIIDEDEQTKYGILVVMVVLFSSYSLLSQPIPEVSPYGTDDSFSLFSHHYQRCYY